MVKKAKKEIDLLSEDDLLPENAKVRITTYIDGDVLLEIKEMAEIENKPYQTLLNEILRAQVIKKSNHEAVRISDFLDNLRKQISQFDTSSKPARPKEDARYYQPNRVAAKKAGCRVVIAKKIPSKGKVLASKKKKEEVA